MLQSARGDRKVHLGEGALLLHRRRIGIFDPEVVGTGQDVPTLEMACASQIQGRTSRLRTLPLPRNANGKVPKPELRKS
jgi:hypothetical protein